MFTPYTLYISIVKTFKTDEGHLLSRNICNYCIIYIICSFFPSLCDDIQHFLDSYIYMLTEHAPTKHIRQRLITVSEFGYFLKNGVFCGNNIS